MKALSKLSASAGACVVLAAAALISAAIANQGTFAPGHGETHTATTATPPGLEAATPSANMLVGISPIGGLSTDAILMGGISGSFGSTTLSGFFAPPGLSGLSNLPGTGIFSLSGGKQNGGRIYHLLPNGNFIGVGVTGFSACPGLVWGSPSGPLYGMVSTCSYPWCSYYGGAGDSLAIIDPFTGATTELNPGGGLGHGLTGVDAIAIDPTTGIMYGSTGYPYDGSPGDVIVIDTTTGLGTDTFIGHQGRLRLPPERPGGGDGVRLHGHDVHLDWRQFLLPRRQNLLGGHQHVHLDSSRGDYRRLPVGQRHRGDFLVNAPPVDLRARLRAVPCRERCTRSQLARAVQKLSRVVTPSVHAVHPRNEALIAADTLGAARGSTGDGLPPPPGCRSTRDQAARL